MKCKFMPARIIFIFGGKILIIEIVEIVLHNK